MTKTILLFVIVILTLAGCSKTSSNTDNTIGWTGTYNGSNLNSRKQINQIVISKVDNSTLQVVANIDSAGIVFTVATLHTNALNGSTFAVNENDAINTIPDSTFHFVASGALSGNNLIVSGSATNTVDASDYKFFYFTGSK